jgi:hypothetical protein
MRRLLSAVRCPIINFRFPHNSISKCKFATVIKFVHLNKGKSGPEFYLMWRSSSIRIVFVSFVLVACSQFLVEFFAWRSVNSSLAAGYYPEHNFYAEVLNLPNMSADLICPTFNNVLLDATGLGWSRSSGMLILVSVSPRYSRYRSWS